MPLIEVIHSSSSNSQNTHELAAAQQDVTTTATALPTSSTPPLFRGGVDGEDCFIAAREAIESLVEHYRQPIHLIASSSIVDDDTDKINQTTKAAVQQAEYAPTTTPPFVEHWLRRLIQQEQLQQQQQQQQNSNYNNSAIMMVQALVHSYVTSIRSTLFTMDDHGGSMDMVDQQNYESSTKLAASSFVNPHGVPVLAHYELLLSKFLEHAEEQHQQPQGVVAITYDEKVQSGNDGLPIPTSKKEDGINNTISTISIFAETLHSMACDITLLTSSSCASASTTPSTDDDIDSDNKNEPPSSRSSSFSPNLSFLVPNVILPTLVRLLQTIQSYIQTNKSSFVVLKDSTTTTTTASDTYTLHEHDKDDLLTTAMRRCDVSVLAFGMPCLGPLQIHAELGNRCIATKTVLQRYAVVFPPRSIKNPTMTQGKGDVNNSSTNSTDSIYLSTSFVESSNGQAWEQGPVTQAALAYWKLKTSSSSSFFPSGDDDSEKSHICSSRSSNLLRDAQRRYFSMVQQRQESSCEIKNSILGQQPASSFLLSMARAVRAHFFGRDMKVPMKTSSSSSSSSCTTTALLNALDHRGMSRHYHDGTSSITTATAQGLQLHQQQSQQEQQQPQQNQQKRLHLGRWTAVKPSFAQDVSQAPFRAIPSRIHVACQFVSLLTAYDEVFKGGSSSSIAEELLPIVMELMSAPVYSVQSWGAACLLHLLSLETTTTAPLHRRHDDAWDDSKIWTLNPVQMDNLLSLLQVNIQTCREGPVLAVLGMAQQELLRRSFMDAALHPTDTKRQSLARRKATQEWLLMLSKNLHSYQQSSNNNHLVWGILVGGIVPLFYDHCTRNVDLDASLIELGQLGLFSLLDLIRNANRSSSILEDEDDVEQIEVMNGVSSFPSDNANFKKHRAEQQDIQLLALLALSNLMVAAHPIMPHHGGKIMCALLSTCCSCTKVGANSRDKNVVAITACTDVLSVVFEWAYHVAAMAIVSCGKRAVDVLDMVLQENNTKNHWDDMGSLAAQEIKRRGDEMMLAMVTKATNDDRTTISANGII
jgi:hypothetical protein